MSKKLTRRKFLMGSGAVVGGGLVLGYVALPNQLNDLAKANKGSGAVLSGWIRITPDNKVTVMVPHSEMGQGVHTALPMMAADELDADWDLVSMEQAPALSEYANEPLGEGFIVGGKSVPDILAPLINKAFYQIAQAMNLQITGGSTSVRFTGHYGMRVAGAAAREMLLRAAAQEWEVSLNSLSASKGVVTHLPSGRSLTYGELAEAASTFDPNPTPVLKAKAEHTIVGTKRKRFDIPSKVDGSAKYGIDAEVDGMLYAAIARVPVHGGTVTSIDEVAAAAMPGVKKICNLGYGVAVVADKYWRAKKALEAVNFEFDGGEASTLNSSAISAKFERDLDTMEPEFDIEKGDVNFEGVSGSNIHDAQYEVPYQAHACMEPLNCTAWVRDGMCDVWTGSQAPLMARATAANAAEVDEENVTVHGFMLGGGFGRRIHAENDYVAPAVEISKMVGAPVKTVWSREEDMRFDEYRPAVISRFRGVLDEGNKPSMWYNRYSDKREPVEAPLVPYSIPGQSIGYVVSQSHLKLGPWRSVDHSQHAFFTESFIDELAYKAGIDPLEYRLSLLGDAPRHAAVLRAAAVKAGWYSGKRGGRAMGAAVHESFGSICAHIAEVSVDESGQLRVHRVFSAVDCGEAINPDNIESQIESAIIYGMTAALYGEITVENGAVVQGNFPDYEMVRMDEVPEIDVQIIESGAPLGGMGEPGLPPIAPAITNAIFAATNIRVRKLPLMNVDLKAGV
ncbi:xanthine dehydrogenase family protein molybdopterin-binding subunit [Kordiimonas aquimaris]|uniref:xanthine dehydrogenase family protein molybdopterin-binding subunit n=1 Tax=Kordiimonas aquimaris TaxID=707591 RepID=UPI0021CEFC28|nr:molybdopterin cofactor-binding domain-containing protein [Kordiimonas aquimaris]